MNYEMSPNVFFCEKLAPTVVTIKFFFAWILHCSATSMYLQMVQNFVFRIEMFWAYLTFQIPFFSSMYCQVFFITQYRSILFPTGFFLARVHLFLWTVDLYVVLQMVFSMERSIADCATKWFSIWMYQSMSNEFEFRWEYFSTMIAFVRWRTEMALLVFCEFLLTSEILLAQETGVLFYGCLIWWCFPSFFDFNGNSGWFAFWCLQARRAWLIWAVFNKKWKIRKVINNLYWLKDRYTTFLSGLFIVFSLR